MIEPEPPARDGGARVSSEKPATLHERDETRRDETGRDERCHTHVNDTHRSSRSDIVFTDSAARTPVPRAFILARPRHLASLSVAVLEAASPHAFVRSTFHPRVPISSQAPPPPPLPSSTRLRAVATNRDAASYAANVMADAGADLISPGVRPL